MIYRDRRLKGFESRKRRDIRNFYLTEEDIPLYEEFKKICKAEGYSMSRVIIEEIRKWVEAHRKGNPQMLMPSFMEGVPIKREEPPPCIHFSKIHKGKVYCNRWGNWFKLKTCWTCWNRAHSRAP